MTKTIYTVILLFLFASVSTYASNSSYDVNCVESIEITPIEVSITKSLVDEIKSNTNSVSHIVKYEFKKYSSRKSRMNNIQNYLKNPEKLDRVPNVLC